MNGETSSAITILSNSFSKQLRWYEELAQIDGKTLSQLVLSRGDMAPLMASIRQKRSIIDLIERERSAIKDIAGFYSKNKAAMAPSPQKDDLERILAASESAMREFLEGENQLKRYLEFMMGKTEMLPQNSGVGPG